MEALRAVPYDRVPSRVPPTAVERVEQKRSRRLSKPRTSSSGKGALKPNLSVGDLSLLTNTPFASTTDVAVLSPDTEQPAIRAPYNNHPPSEAAKDNKRDGNDTVKGNRLQRTGTKIARRITVRRSFNDKSVNRADETELAIEGYELIIAKARQDRLAMNNHNFKPGSEADVEAMAPIRRKSLLTPGLATRGSDILRKPPSSKAHVDVQLRYYNPNLSPMSPLARIASMEVPADSTDTPSDTTRATTPAELDYGRIGGLRITNGGAVSPALTLARSPERPTQHPLASNIDFLETISDGGWSDAETVSVRDSTLFSPIMTSKGATTLIVDTYAEDAGNPWLDEDQDILGVLNSPPTTSQPRKKSKSTPQLQRWPTVTSAYSESDHGSVAPNDYFSGHGEVSLPAAKFPSTELLPRTNERSNARSRPESALEPTSRMNEEDALLFEDDLSNAPPSLCEPTSPLEQTRRGDFPPQTSRLVMAKIIDSMMAASRFTPVPQSEDEIRDHLHVSNSPVSERPPLSATDSGYVSSASFGSSGKGISPASSVSHSTVSSQSSVRPSGPRAAPRPPQHYKPDSKSIAAVDTSAALPPEPPRHALKPAREAEARHFPTSAPVSSPFHHPVSSAKARPVEPDRDRSSPSPAPRPQDKPRQGSPAGKKLQKRPPRSKSMPPPVDRIVITACTEPESSSAIPSIPAHMAAKNAQRWHSRPNRDRASITPIRTAYAPENLAVQQPQPAIQPLRYDSSGFTMPETQPPPVPPKDERRHRATRSEQIPSQAAQRAHRADAATNMEASLVSPAQRRRPEPLAFGNKPTNQNVESQRRPATATVATFAQASAVDDDEAIDWAKYRRAWAARRKSAGEALKQRPDFETMASHSSKAKQEAITASGHVHRRTRTEHDAARGGSGDVRLRVQQFESASSSRHPSAEPSPLKPHNHQGYFSGCRYEGGFDFGYEPGKGVGGSAGTRGAGGNAASRKGGRGDLARGFGVDLSDVPVFISRG